MLTGKRYRLNRSTLGLRVFENERVLVTIPTRSVIQVVSEPTNRLGMVTVLWDGRTIELFAADLEERGTKILKSAGT